jgi:2-haloacid dehalogenase
MENLAQGHYFLPGAEAAVARLSEKYKLYLVSNGTTDVQMSRLESAGIGKYFQEIFISQDIGVDKPDKVFFDRCFARIPGFEKQKAMIVGDSLTSDIQGGRNAGIATCWVNPKEKPAREDIPADYQIKALSELEALLETL